MNLSREASGRERNDRNTLTVLCSQRIFAVYTRVLEKVQREYVRGERDNKYV